MLRNILVVIVCSMLCACFQTGGNGAATRFVKANCAGYTEVNAESRGRQTPQRASIDHEVEVSCVERTRAMQAHGEREQTLTYDRRGFPEHEAQVRQELRVHAPHYSTQTSARVKQRTATPRRSASYDGRFEHRIETGPSVFGVLARSLFAAVDIDIRVKSGGRRHHRRR